jgi:probable F420-dependent oxidoreductase
MRFGVCLPSYGRAASPRAIVTAAREAEALGYDSVWSTDHLLVPRNEARLYGRLFEALTTLAYLAPLTRHIRLGTSVLVLPLRNPGAVAKQVAALDVFSGGRVLLGVGAGWLAEEFRYLDSDYGRRGARLDEAIRLLRAIWTEPTINFAGQFYRVRDAVSEPKPRQPGGPPLWIGGDSPAALRRAAQLGDAWHPVGPSPDALRAGVARIHALRGTRSVLISMRILVTPSLAATTYRGTLGRRRHTLGGARPQMIRQLEAYQSAGLEYIVCYFGDVPLSVYRTRLRACAQDLLPRFRERSSRRGAGSGTRI